MLRTKTREDQKSRSSLRKKLKKKKMTRQRWKRVPGASSTHNGLSFNLESCTKKTNCCLISLQKFLNVPEGNIR